MNFYNIFFSNKIILKLVDLFQINQNAIPVKTDRV